MEPCPSQGPGYARIPGTTACIRAPGRLAEPVERTAPKPRPLGLSIRGFSQFQAGTGHRGD